MTKKKTEESKVDNVEEAQAYITYIKNNNDKADAYNISTRNNNYTVKKSEESRATLVYNRPN